MKNLLTTFFFAVVSFGIPMGFLFGLFYSNMYIGIISGIASGFSFGLILVVFVHFQAIKFEKLSREMPDFVFGGGANHFLNNEAVGGYLYLLKDKLFFKSHSANVQNHELIILLKDINSVSSTRTAGFIPNGLLVSTLNGEERFVVFGNKKWVSLIENTKKVLV